MIKSNSYKTLLISSYDKLILIIRFGCFLLVTISFFIMNFSSIIYFIIIFLLTFNLLLHLWIIRNHTKIRGPLAFYINSSILILIACLFIFYTGGFHSPFYLLLFFAPIGAGMSYGEKSTLATIFLEIILIVLFSLFDKANSIFNIGSEFSILYLIPLLMTAPFSWIVCRRFIDVKNAQEQKEIINKKLLIAYQELQTIDKAKSDFVSIASHQLRTPISIIRGYLGMLIQGDYGKIKNNKVMQVLKNANNNAERLADIINEILDASRIEQGRLGITIEKVDLVQMMLKISLNQEKAAKAKKLEFNVILPNVKEITIECDPEKIYEVISNLIDNAIQYTIKGKVIVEIKDMISYILIIITDTGIGIPKNQKDKLFQRFIRLDNAKLLKPDGTGIGLFTTKKILEAHQGKVWFDSIEGKGTKFYIRLQKKISKENTSLFQNKI